MNAFHLFVYLTAAISCVLCDPDFTYYGTLGPDHWSERYNQCAGKHQSPINIDDVDVVDRVYAELAYNEFEKIPIGTTITNNGHTVLVKLTYDGAVPFIWNGPLEGKGKYEFQQLHFHWGEDNTVGSEDRINNVTYPMELHVVFRNMKYEDFDQAVRRDDGVAVMAFFYVIDDNSSLDYDNFTGYLKDIHEPGTTIEAESTSLYGLLPEDLSSYYTYMGSLTTPPCSEDVIWMDFSDPISISPLLLERFRALKTFGGSSLDHNFRPVQPLNNRKVYRVIRQLKQPHPGSDIPFVNAWNEGNGANAITFSKWWAVTLMASVIVLQFFSNFV